MKYFAMIGENEYEVVIEKDQILVDGKPVNIDLMKSGGSELYSVLYNGQSHELIIDQDRSTYSVTMGAEHFDVSVEDERTRRLNAGRKVADLPKGEFAVVAPIPGLVIKVLVAEGDEVAEQQPLVLLEAMKMENEIRAPRAGVIKKVEVKPSQQVEQNSALVILE